jgi:hypothetical protein
MASENAVAITNDLATGFSETSKSIETADQFASYAVVIGETATVLAILFVSTKNQ